MAVKNFSTASRRGEAAVTNPVDIVFEIDDEKLTAHAPTTGQMALFIGGQTGGIATIQALFDFLTDILDEGDFEIIRDKMREGVDILLVTEIVEYLIEEWSGRPTKPSSASSASRKRTGKASTVKRASKAKT